MARAVVTHAALRSRGLPPVSVKSGESADGFAPVGSGPSRVYLPLTQPEFDRLLSLRKRQRSAVFGGLGCLLFGLALARFPAMLPLGAAIAVLSGAIWVVAWLAIRSMLPNRAEGPGSDEVTLSRVHRGFAAAVTEARP